MFGDDPDPTVTTARVGFGEVRTSKRGGLCTLQGDSGLGKREKQRIRLVLERATKARGNATTTS